MSEEKDGYFSEEKDGYFYENRWACDGECGRYVEISDSEQYTDKELRGMLKMLGWLVVGKEAFCTKCQEVAHKIVAATKRNQEVAHKIVAATNLVADLKEPS